MTTGDKNSLRSDAGGSIARAAGSPGFAPILALILALALAACALAICGYRFGVADQIQYLAHYTDVRFPGTLDADPYSDAFGALRSLAWEPIAWTTPEGALPWMVLGVMLAAVTASALVLMWLGRTLLGRATPLLLAAAPALVLVTPKEQNYLGLVSLGDVELTATVMVMTLVFASMTLFARGRVVWSLVVAAAAAPVHGQTAAYLLVAWCAATLIAHRSERRTIALVVGVGLAGVVGVILARPIGPVDPGDMDAYARLGRELYAPLIDIRLVPLKSWGAVVFVLAFGALALPGYLRNASLAPTRVRDARERLLVYAVGSLAFPLLGWALLASGLEEPLLWRLMVSRSLMLVQIVSLVVAGVWAADLIRRGGIGAWAGTLALLGLVLWPTPSLGHLAAGAVGVVTLGAIGLGLAPTRGAPRAEPSTGRRAPPGACAAWLGVLALGLAAFAMRPYPWTTSPVTPAWRDAQAWARAQTPEGSVFLTPPYLAGWRVGSHRPAFGELRDGGLLFYAGAPALGWERRMRLFGMTPRAWWFEVSPADTDRAHSSLRAQYADALGAHAGELGTLTGARYVVVEHGDAPWVRTPVYANELLEIYELGGVAE